MADDDWTIPEIVRNIKRLDTAIQRCVNEEYYQQAQKNVGERIEAQDRRITTIEAERKSETADRVKQRQQLTLAVIAAAVSAMFSLGLKVIDLVSK